MNKNKKQIAYLGPEGTFSEQVIIENLDKNLHRQAQDNVFQVLKQLSEEKVDLALVPIENSLVGVVASTLKELLDFKEKYFIKQEFCLTVHHNLLSKAKNKEDIKKVFSHTHAIPQCINFLNTNFPYIRPITTQSTIEGVKFALEDTSSAAIASSYAAQKYDIPILYKNIEDYKNNLTRFLLLGKDKESQVTGNDKTSILVHLEHKSGSLVDCLSIFKQHNINLHMAEKIRASQGKNYNFFLDFDGHYKDKKVIEVFNSLEIFRPYLLGSYPKKISF